MQSPKRRDGPHRCLATGRSRDLFNPRPPQYRPHSDFGQDVEHALAFLLIGLAFGLAYPRQRPLTAGVAILMIGALEVLQLFAPGRHARIEDFAVDALAAGAGFALVAVLTVLAAL